jgi:hypothetical protein
MSQTAEQERAARRERFKRRRLAGELPSPGITASIGTQTTNARSKRQSCYPYASMRLPKRMKGLPHADGKTAYGRDGFVPTKGTTIIPDAKTKREMMSGAFNGERYGED